MIQSIRHIGLVVTDIKEALRFWCDTMGFSVIRVMEESGPYIDKMLGLKGVRVTTAKISDPAGNILELLKFNSHPDKSVWDGQPYSTGLTHIALTVQDINKTITQLKKYNLKIPVEPQLSPDGLVKVVYINGPEGLLIELVEVLK